MAQTEYQKEYYIKNRERIIERTKVNQAKRYADDPDYHKNLYRKKAEANPIRVWARNTLGTHRQKGYNVVITIDELVSIAETSKTCYICGKPISTNVGKNVAQSMYSMSLDRVNNEQDITKDNVKICCVQCNASKGGRSMEDFVEYCKRVVESQGYTVSK